MLAREDFLDEGEYSHYGIEDYLIIPASLNILAGIFLIVGFCVSIGASQPEDIRNAVALLHVMVKYFEIAGTIFLGTVFSCAKYIANAKNEDNLRFRIQRSFIYGFVMPTLLSWGVLKGIAWCAKYVTYELPVKIIWKKIDTMRTQKYELEHADELLIEEQKDVQQLLGK